MPRALAAAPEQSALDWSAARLRVGFVRGHLLDVVVKLPGARGDEAERQAAEDLVWGLLGDRTAGEWVRRVEVEAAPRRGPLRIVGQQGELEDGLRLDELLSAVRAATDGVWAELPAERLFSLREPRWTLLEIEPMEASDWARMDDVVLAGSFLPELLKCYLEGEPFSSVRFSRHDEVFACLKYQAEGTDEERLATRNALEDALDARLMDERAGRVIGNGFGLRYAYLDLALSQVARGLEIARELGQAHALPRRAWILPLDDALEDEWLEIWPGAEPPPGVGG